MCHQNNNWEIVAFEQVKNAGQEREKFLVDFTQLPARCRPPQLHGNLIPAPLLREFLLLGDGRFQAQFFLAYEAGEDPLHRRPWASIGINHLQTAEGQLGYFHFFEMNFAQDRAKAQAAALALVSSGEDQLRTAHCAQLFGPITYNTWFSYRYLLSIGDHLHHYQWEPVNPPEYPAFFLQAGFSLQRKYHTRASGQIHNFIGRTLLHYQQALAAGYHFRAIGEDDLQALYNLSMEGFAQNYLFSPITFSQFAALYVPMIKKYDFSQSYFALDGQGNEIGFFLIFPDGNSVVLKTVAIIPAHRGQGLSNALIHLALRGLVQQYGHGYFTGVISALMIDQAQSESYSKYGPLLWEHQYGLLAKNLLPSL